MQIFLCDFGHTYFSISPSTIPLGIAYIGATLKRYFPDVEIKLFKYPEKFLEALKYIKPDIVGFGLYNWNQNLSVYLAEETKVVSKSSLLVAGGPNIPGRLDDLKVFAESLPYDIYIPYEGELPMVSLVEGKFKGGFSHKNKQFIAHQPIPFIEKDLNNIPSPYLANIVDDMLSESLLSPVLQTMRGCPYSCTFCVGGVKECSSLRLFPLERVKSEILYLKEKAKNRLLRITDDNLGMFERDVEIAAFIKNLSMTENYPEAVKVYTDKKVNERTKSIMMSLKDFIPYNISLQTATDSVLRNIKRKNISFEQMADAFRWAKKNNMITATEMIHGFPGESCQSYLDAVNKVYSLKVDSSTSTELWALPNTEIASQESRKNYEIETRFTLGADAVSIINDKVICEYDEHVVKTRDMSIDEHYNLCELDLYVCLTSYYGYLRELNYHAMNYGIKPTDIFSEIRKKEYPVLSSLFKTYRKSIQQNHFKTKEEAGCFIEESIKKDRPIPPTRFDTTVVGNFVFFDLFEKGIDEYIGALSKFNSAKEFVTICKELKKFTLKMVINPHDPKEAILIKSKYNVYGWILDFYEKPLSNYEEKVEMALKAPNMNHLSSLYERGKTLRNKEERIQNFFRHTNSSGIRRIASII